MGPPREKPKLLRVKTLLGVTGTFVAFWKVLDERWEMRLNSTRSVKLIGARLGD